MRVLALALLLAGSASAAPMSFKFKKKVETGLLHAELRAAGFNVSGVTCSGSSCVIQYGPGGESKSPMAVITAHIYKDPAMMRLGKTRLAREISGRVRAGTATQKEKDELLSLLVEVFFGY